MPSSEDITPAAIRNGTIWGSIVLDNGQKIWMKKYRTEISASTASLLSTLCAYPLDSVKTRMQAYGYKFPNFVSCVKHTYATEGIHGFLRGAIAPLGSITIVRTISFSIYQKSKYTYDDMIHKATGVSPLLHANTKGAWPNLYTMACFGAAGATSGAVITAISCPFELTKLSAQISVLMENGADTENGSTNKKTTESTKSPVSSKGAAVANKLPTKTMGTFSTAKLIIQRRGLIGLYSGFHLHLLRDTIGTTLYFTTYESSKQMLANARGNSPTSPLAVVTAGGLCGLVSWLCIYPVDSAKSIYQRNTLLAHFGKQPPAGEPSQGPKIEFFNRRMYRGLGVSMSRSCLINAIFFSVFELMKKQINKLEVGED